MPAAGSRLRSILLSQLGVDGHLTSWASKSRCDKPATSATDKSSDMQKRKDGCPGRARSSSGKPFKKGKRGRGDGKTPIDKKERDQRFIVLARKHQRCFRCGFFVKATECDDYKAKCLKDKQAFLRRMGMVAAKDARGEGPTDFESRANK